MGVFKIFCIDIVLLFPFFYIFPNLSEICPITTLSFPKNGKKQSFSGKIFKKFFPSLSLFSFLSDFIFLSYPANTHFTGFSALFYVEIIAFRNLSDYILLFQKFVRLLSETCPSPFRNLSDFIQKFVRLHLEQILVL